jgi:hypothetical protein
MSMLVECQRVRPRIFDGIAEPVKRAHARIAAPRKNQTISAPHANELIVDDVRRHAN